MRHLTLLLCAITLCAAARAQEDTGKKTVPMKKIVAQDTNGGSEKRQTAEKVAENVKEGCTAPDFTLKDIKGNDLSLSSLRGKYVVLDFWGSWCGWCVKGIPSMKEYYAKYSGKFEILGIDCRDTEEKWRQAVADYELPWLHVYNPADGTITATYAIQGYPTKIVVDPKGVIAKVIIGESEDFYAYLDELFGK